ncbi:MAG: isochorismatase family protein [Pseudomonadota bacterium]
MTHSDREANYSGAYNSTLGFGKKPALILVDFVAAYFDRASALYAGVEDALASALRVREAAHAADLPVFLTRVSYDPEGKNGGVFFRKVAPLRDFVEGSPLGNWAPGLTPTLHEHVVTKQYPSAFFGTSLATTLKTMDIDTLVITGLTTSGCVRATCVDAMSHGYVPIVVAEACGDRHADPHEANLFDMHAKYGDVMSEAEVIAHLESLR